MYLLDTNVISELRKPRPHAGVLAWLEQVAESQLFICALSIGEIQAGIEITREQDAQKAADIEAWLLQLADSFQVLPMDAGAFRLWGTLTHRKHDTLIEDAMIAACALQHGLTVVTRNVADFKVFGVPVLDPFKAGAKLR